MPVVPRRLWIGSASLNIGAFPAFDTIPTFDSPSLRALMGLF
jgi:hypothetical protein